MQVKQVYPITNIKHMVAEKKYKEEGGRPKESLSAEDQDSS